MTHSITNETHSITNDLLDLQRGVQATRAMAALSRRLLDEIAQRVRDRVGEFIGRGGFGPDDAAAVAFEIVLTHAREQGLCEKLSHRNHLIRLLTTVAVRKALTAIRDEQRRVQGRDHLGEIEGVPASDLPPEACVAFADYLRHLTHGLPPDLEELLQWLEEGLSYREIAAKRNGCSPSLVAYHVKRLRLHIASRLDPEDRVVFDNSEEAKVNHE